MSGLSGLSALSALSGSGGSGGNTVLAITSNGGGPTASISYNETLTSAITTVTATGGTAPRTFSITGGADSAAFSINSSTGALTPAVAFDYENPTDVGTNNSYIVEVTVTDGVAATDSQTITVNVQAVEEPTVYTLTLSDLGNFVNNANSQLLRFDVTYVSGSVTTSAINLWDGAGSLKASSTVTSDLLAALNSAMTESNSVTDVSSGGNYIFTVSFPEQAVVTSFTLNAGLSQLFPTITLTESVTQQGVDAVQEVVSITAVAVEVGVTGDTTTDSNGNSVTVDINDAYVSNSPGSGWTAGSPSGNTVVFTQNTGADVSTSKSSGNGTVTVTTEGVTGVVEIHLISRNVAPTGGTWKPYGAGTAINHNADALGIATQIGSNFGGASVTADQALSAGNVTITAIPTGSVSDTALAPANVDLTAPAISVAIT